MKVLFRMVEDFNADVMQAASWTREAPDVDGKIGRWFAVRVSHWRAKGEDPESVLERMIREAWTEEFAGQEIEFAPAPPAPGGATPLQSGK